MDQKKSPLGIILCGGLGRRADGADKGLLRFGDATAVEAIASLLRPVCDTLVISANRNLARYRALRIGSVVCDLRPGFHGPLAGIEAAAAHFGAAAAHFEAAAAHFGADQHSAQPLAESLGENLERTAVPQRYHHRAAVLVPCDTPGIHASVVHRLLTELGEGTKTDAVYAAEPGKSHYLCAALRLRALPTATEALDREERSVHRWYASLNARPLPLPPDLSLSLANLNNRAAWSSQAAK